MAVVNETDLLSSLLPAGVSLRTVEPHIFSVLAANESGNEYDTPFGFAYDWVACNPVYNRLVWGYSVRLFSQTAAEALNSSADGPVLDIGCGSLAFTAGTYSQHTGRPVVLADQSLKMLRMAKARLVRRSGHVPGHLVFLHADALQLPFRENRFSTILSENLLHCLDDTGILLRRLKAILAPGGKMVFTTLVKAGRLADKYLEALADSGKLVSRTVADHMAAMDQAGLTATYETTGNILVIRCGKEKNH
jgi:ubiquinone/menaquinone biosynthesis C-methylase UbiE